MPLNLTFERVFNITCVLGLRCTCHGPELCSSLGSYCRKRTESFEMFREMYIVSLIIITIMCCTPRFCEFIILFSNYCLQLDVRYCGLFVGTDWEAAAIFSGTVFKEILIWCPNENSSQKGEGSASEVLHRLKGHDVSYVHNSSCFLG